jgi:hypothetical protein
MVKKKHTHSALDLGLGADHSNRVEPQLKHHRMSEW